MDRDYWDWENLIVNEWADKKVRSGDDVSSVDTMDVTIRGVKVDDDKPIVGVTDKQWPLQEPAIKQTMRDMAVEQDPNGIKADDHGAKYNASKLGMNLINGKLSVEQAIALTFGAIKYEEENWRKGIPFMDQYGAMLRHLLLWKFGEDYDEESGAHHFGAVAFAMECVLEYMTTHPELDNRYKDPEMVKRIKEATNGMKERAEAARKKATGEGNKIL